MSVENVTLFMEQVKSNDELQRKLNTADKAYNGVAEMDAIVTDVILPIAKQAGFDFSVEEFLNYQKNTTSSELTDDELETVAGGWGCCALLGFSTKPEAEVSHDYKGVGVTVSPHACVYIGIGVAG